MIETIIAYFAGPLGLVELFGTIFSAICVYLAIKHNMWTWFFGALGVILFGYLFLQFGLISDAGLQILFFLPMQVVGFIMWRRYANQSQNKAVTKAMSWKPFAVIAVVIALMALGNGWVAANYTLQFTAWLSTTLAPIGLEVTVQAASFPYLDALTTWMSIAAQLLMIAKFRESWILWVGMDIIAIPLYFAKGLVVVSGLYVGFLVLAIYGGIVWYRDYAKQNKVNASSIPLVRSK
jgi:nicotinamide mononucleotide transporter|tara:strand:- start:53 stop:760 length:708 start_codon:yes stop_codon:yes gene_type:complete